MKLDITLFNLLMSLKIKLKDLTIDEREQIMKELRYEIELNSGGGNTRNDVKHVYSYKLDKDDQTVTLPFYYVKNVLKKGITLSFTTDTTFPKFQGKLYDEQITSRNECIQHLNTDKSCILSLPVGCGKCLHPDTKLILFNGDIKTAKEIKIDDVLIGDNGSPRIVKSTVIGKDNLYTIYNDDYNVNYTVNSNHILTLYNIITNSIQDVSIKDVIPNIKFYQGIRTSVFNLGGKSLKERYDELYTYFKAQSVYKTKDDELKERLVFIGRSVGFEMKVKCIDGVWYIYKNKIKMTYTYPIMIKYHSYGTFCGFEISGNGRFLLSDFTITHNTATSINIATKIKLPTLIILNRLLLMDQWKSSIFKFCPDAKVHIIKPKDKVIPTDSNFYIMNAINVDKFKRDFYSFIGFCIVDECHMIMSEVISKCMWSIEPKYLLGLSATPYRVDGLNEMINSYFGPTRVTQNMERKHIVYKINTSLKIEFTYNRFGKMDWNSLINAQSTHPERNQMIIDIVKRYPERYFLLLTKRIEQGKILSDMLTKEDIEHDCLFGVEKYIESEKHVLIGTTGKCGVGFDAPKLNTLVLCNDMVNYYIQMLGRVMRQKDSDAWVFDLVDENPILKKHYYERCKVYKEYGGTFSKE